jgi:hypothetical protein
MVPEGHTVHVMPPGVNGVANAPMARQNTAASNGMIDDPAQAGALAAMNAAIPTLEQSTQKSSKTKSEPARKKSGSGKATQKEREKNG